MKYTTHTADNEMTVSLAGKLTIEERADCRTILTEMAEDQCAKKIVELDRLEDIDMAGFGILMQFKEACQKNNQQLFLRVGEDGMVAKRLSVAKFYELIPYA